MCKNAGAKNVQGFHIVETQANRRVSIALNAQIAILSVAVGLFSRFLLTLRFYEDTFAEAKNVESFS
jgi:hypothetical protein